MIKKILPLMATILLVACSGKPSSGDAEKAFLNKVKNGSSVEVEVKSFKALKSYTQEVLGTQVHVIDYEAEVSYPNGVNAHCKGRPFDGACMMVQDNQIIEPGGVKQRKGSLEFEKTSEGWKGPDGNFY